MVTLAALSIRNLDDDIHQRLRIRAAEHGRSMEAEARAILAEAVRPDGPKSGNLFTELYERFQELGGVELDIPKRSNPIREIDFS